MERKRQRISLLGRIGLLGLAVERKRQRIGLLGLAMERERCSEEGVGRSLWQIGGSVEVSVGSCCGKEEAENRAIGSYRGKGEAEDRLW